MFVYKDNQSLLKDLTEGKVEAFEFLFKSYYPRLKNYAAHFINDDDEIEDIIQDCYVHLWERRQQLTPISLSALLFTMVRNGCLNYLKHKVIRENYEISSKNKQATGEELFNYDFMDTNDSELLYDELQRQIKKVLDQLPARSRQVFVMSRMEGLKNREIAEELGISIKVVEKHITKALAAFRKNLQKMKNSPTYLVLLAWYATML